VRVYVDFPITVGYHLQFGVVESKKDVPLSRCSRGWGGVFNRDAQIGLPVLVNVNRSRLHIFYIFQTHFGKIGTIFVDRIS
jgi:hypothetical protein